jgi:SAM-dependent MidA family methyltransferase
VLDFPWQIMREESFEHFMQRALHDPQAGYYARRIRAVGQAGDFTTAVMLSETPARAIASWIARAMRESKCLDVIELGPGEGRLAREILRRLPWTLRWRVRLHLVESSAPLQARQRELLGRDRRVHWHGEVLDALAACGGRAVLYSNEFADAFAVRRYERVTDGWREIGLRWSPGREIPEEFLLPEADLPASSVFALDPAPGWRVEVADAFHGWLREMLPRWRAGRMLTLDYGGRVETLYHRRPGGTLRGYLLQQRCEGPEIYRHPGRQDLTADVNFTDLIAWAGPWVEDVRLESFGDFLRPFLRQSAGTDATLADPSGVGGAFQVLDFACKPPRQA